MAGEKQLSLGLADAETFSVMQITPEEQLLIRHLTKINEAGVESQVIISGNETQGEINSNMEKIINQYKTLFQRLGRASVEPTDIEIE